MKPEDLITKYNISNLTTNTVMVVDDEKENVQVMEIVLGKQFNILAAMSGREALKLLETEACDVVVVDQRMPGMTGVELLTRIRSLDRDITGIVVTAYAEYKAIMTAINRGGAFKFILKPFDGTQLIASIHEAMEKTFDARAIRELVKLLDVQVGTLEQKNREMQAMQTKLIQAERFSAVGRMTSGIVHDMGNALSGLLFMGQELRASECAKDVRDIFNVSVQGLEKLHNTLQEIKTFARNGGVVGMLRKEEADTETLIRDAVKMAQLNKEAVQRRIEVNVRSGLPALLVDRDRILQVIVNLLNNAVDATGEDGHILVDVSSRKNWVKITVQDDGTGMDEDVLDHVFEPMFSTKDNGLGMGLYMSEAIVKAHGGSVSVHSEHGGGTEFRIILPVN